jgi:hypothetical protein
MIESVLILATIAQRFYLEPIDEKSLDEGPVRIQPAITLRPAGPITLRLCPLNGLARSWEE